MITYKRRLSEEATLTFKKVLEIAQATETPTNNNKDIQQANVCVQPWPVHHLPKEQPGKISRAIEAAGVGMRILPVNVVLRTLCAITVGIRGTLSRSAEDLGQARQRWQEIRSQDKHSLSTE